MADETGAGVREVYDEAAALTDDAPVVDMEAARAEIASRLQALSGMPEAGAKRRVFQTALGRLDEKDVPLAGAKPETIQRAWTRLKALQKEAQAAKKHSPRSRFKLTYASH